MDLKKEIKITAIILTILFAALAIITFIKQDEISSAITEKVEAYGLLIILVVTALSEILPQYIGPAAILVQSLVIGLPVTDVLIFVSLGSIIGSVIAFELGRKYGMPLILKIYNFEKVHALEEKTDKYGKWVILIGAVTPFPYFALIFGSLGIKRKTLIFYGIIPRIFGLIILTLFFY